VTECQQCSAKSQLFLCNTHVAELRDMLYDLPRLAAHLSEAATGQTKLGEPARRNRSDEQPMRVNLRASDLEDHVNRTLVRWVQDITEQRGLTYRALRIYPPGYVGYLEPGDVVSAYGTDTAKLAFWLGHHTEVVAGDEAAGQCFDEISDHMTRILAVINRPVPPRFCGPCPSGHPDDSRKRCSAALMAKRDAVEVTCPQCATTHNVDDLMRRLMAEVDHWRFTRKEVLLIMATLGDKLSDRTFRHWRKLGIVKPCGYRRPDGRDAFTRHGDDDEPLYRLSEVRRAKYKTLTTTGS
jgi:hypothetical protein